MSHNKGPEYKIGTGYRADKLGEVNTEDRTVEVVFGSEYPVVRWMWNGRDYEQFNEILSFDPEHIDIGRMEGGTAPVLDNHDRYGGTRSTLGVVESAELKGDHGTAVLRFSKKPSADEVFQDVQDGILRAVSVGYVVREYQDTGEVGANGLPNYRATDWEALEVSIAPVPADPNAKTTGSREHDVTTAVRIIGRESEAPEVKKPVKEVRKEAQKEDKKQVTQATRDAKPQNKSYMKVNINDLKASRKALEDEFGTLDVLTERDETQEARYNEVIAKIDDLNASIEREEKAEAIRAARVAAGEAASNAEEKEKKNMVKRFSFSEAVRGALSGGVTGVAAEMREHAINNGHTGAGDIVIPGDFQRAGAADDFQAGSGDGSGYVATESGTFIEGLMMPLSIEAWGTQVFNNQMANLKFPRESVNADATQEGEVDAGAASGAEMDELTLSPVRFHNDTKYSKQLLIQGGNAVESDIAGILRRGHERRLLKHVFNTALAAATDIAAADGADYDAIANSLINTVLGNEGLTENCRFVFSPSTHEYMQSAVSVTGISQLLNENTKTLKGGYSYHATPYMADASAGVGQVLFGDWANAVLAYFGGIDIVVDPYSAKDTAQVELTMNRWADFDLRQAGGFAMENGVAVS